MWRWLKSLRWSDYDYRALDDALVAALGGDPRMVTLRRAARVRTISGRRVSCVGLDDMAVANPGEADHRRIANAVAAVDSRIDSGDPQVQAVEGGTPPGTEDRHYAGVAFVAPLDTWTAPSVDWFAGHPNEVTSWLAAAGEADVITAGFGWIIRTRLDGSWLLPDPDRSLELELLDLLCQDAEARQRLWELAPSAAGFSSQQWADLVGRPPRSRLRRVAWALVRSRSRPRNSREPRSGRARAGTSPAVGG